MKFAEQLSTQLTPEWRKKYISYDTLKEILYTSLEKAPSGDVERKRYFDKCDDDFFKRCEDELNKINLFFMQKLAESQSKYRELMVELEMAHRLVLVKKTQDTTGKMTTSWIQRLGFSEKGKRRGSGIDISLDTALLRMTDDEDQKIPPRTIRKMKTALKEFYLELILLQNYQELNVTGFRKILKKHDKLWENIRGNAWKTNVVDAARFAVSKEVDTLIKQVEDVYSEQFESGNRAKAMKSLRVLPLSETQSATTTFVFGLFTGMFVVIVVAIVLSAIHVKDIWNPPWLVIRLYRGLALVFVMVVLAGVNMYTWQSSGVNYVLIFEIDPRNHLTYQKLLAIGATFLSIWGLFVLGYFYAAVIGIPRLCFPLILTIGCFVWLINPFKHLRSSRYWLLKRVWHCMAAPFYVVTFPDFWLADQFNSLVVFFLDMEYFICFYAREVDYSGGTMKVRLKNVPGLNITGSELNDTTYWGVDWNDGSDVCGSNIWGIRPIISFLPALIRLIQCIRRYRDHRQVFPHLWNAGKYSTIFFVILFGSFTSGQRRWRLDDAFFYLWILAYIVSFIYTYYWDVKVDWGLFAKNGYEHRWLREELIYKRVWVYYAAMVVGFVMRLGWVLNVSLSGSWFAYGSADMVMCVTATIELVRRCMWNCFRLENEHLNNVGLFRAVRDISIVPLRKEEFAEILGRIEGDAKNGHLDDGHYEILRKRLNAIRTKTDTERRKERRRRKRKSIMYSRKSLGSGGEQKSGNLKNSSSEKPKGAPDNAVPANTTKFATYVNLKSG